LSKISGYVSIFFQNNRITFVFVQNPMKIRQMKESTYPNGKPAMKWISKYAIADIAPYQAPQTVADRQNERGLRLEVLLLINLS
jgi:penicillin V acylase-like amidase (Ntn superfamily)